MKLFLAVFAAVAVAVSGHAGMTHRQAVAFLRGDSFDSTVTGNVTFTEQHDGNVLVEGTILGLEHGKYGFHIHEKGDITGGCISTGPHYNPENKLHGAPSDKERHVGDLGNVEFDGYRIARISIVDPKIKLDGEHSILGRAVVLHSGVDDLGKGGHPDSRKTGNAGGRVACGVIGILSPVDGWSTTNGVSGLYPRVSFLLISLWFLYNSL